MSEETTTPSLFSGRLSTFGSSLRLRSFNSNQLSPALVLRPLEQEVGSFRRAVSCSPGVVTVVMNSEDPSAHLATVRSTLFSDLRSGRLLDMRYGKHSLHPSEIHVVSPHVCYYRDLTVQEALHKAGIVEAQAHQIADVVGLSEKLPTRVEELSSSELRRLNILCAIYARNIVVLFDQPFLNLEREWIETVATLILEAAERTGRICIVVGESEIPSVWSKADAVVVEDVSEVTTRKRQNSHHGGDEEVESALASVREMMATARDNEFQEQSIITRPQRIHSMPTRAVSNPGRFRQERIANPRMQEIVKDIEAEDGTSVDVAPSELMPEVTRSRKRRSSGKLTGVPRGYRFRRESALATAVRRLVDGVHQFLYESSFGVPLPSSAKIEDSKRRIALQRTIFIVTVVACGLLIASLLR